MTEIDVTVCTVGQGALAWPKALGCVPKHGPESAAGEDFSWRSNDRQVVLEGRLRQALPTRLNLDLRAEAL